MEEEMKNEAELALQFRNLKSCFFTSFIEIGRSTASISIDTAINTANCII